MILTLMSDWKGFEMALTEKDLKKWQRACDHLTRMDNDAEYCKEIEKQLYRGAPEELIESMEREMAKYETKKRNKNSLESGDFIAGPNDN